MSRGKILTTIEAERLEVQELLRAHLLRMQLANVCVLGEMTRKKVAELMGAA